MRLVELKLSELLKEVAADSPAPGGGSVSAIIGAFSASLGEMVCRLTVGKKKYEQVWAEMENIANELARLRSELEVMIDADTEAFNDLMTAYKLPKETEEEKSIRKDAIAHATVKATQIPLRTMELSLLVLRLLPSVAEKGNQSSISDAGVSALASLNAVKGAFLNVLINLPGIENPSLAEEIRTKSEAILRESESLCNQVMDYVNSKLKP